MTAPIALTGGEPAGIGGEIALQAWLRRERRSTPFFLLDDPLRLAALAGALGWRVPVKPIAAPEDAAGVFATALPVLAVKFPARVIPGKPDSANAPAVIRAIADAVGFVQARRAAALVTNPIQKETLYQAGFPHPGHTEFLGELAGGMRPVMMLVCPELRVVPVTVHVPLAAALKALTRDEIVAVGRIAARALRNDFGIAKPRLAVAGLNPHAGEHGTMGSEEGAIVEPAIAVLRADGIDAFGPLPPDTMFHAGARKRYDAALCMYHDQALIPLKTIDFDGGVNITLGLPFIRTSPDHGTACDIAGHGVANPASLIAALELAALMAERRAALSPAG
jgi:4-hydroxythreonine-4-phosphate dehydrogenase